MVDILVYGKSTGKLTNNKTTIKCSNATGCVFDFCKTNNAVCVYQYLKHSFFK